MIIIKQNKNQHRIIITPGEPAGIGPDITIMIAQKTWPVELVVCADPNLLLNRAKQINLPLKLRTYYSQKIAEPCAPGEISILNISLAKKTIPGQLDVANSNYVIDTLNRAAKGCINGEFAALVTGPVHKAVINTSGISFHGHTEFFSENYNNKNKKTVMMFSNGSLRIALATTHIPIVSVSQSITQLSLYNTITVLAKGLKKYFNITCPTIYVCGLNPHCGESGYIGKEEIEIIIPTLNILRKKTHYKIIGPLSADTIFQPKYLKNADVILTMYHDQGLPVLKYSGFNQSTNITFGLPFIRTSVDHGTALELSGSKTKLIHSNSMAVAISTAIDMINNIHAKK